MHNQTDRTNLPEPDGSAGREQAASRVGSGGDVRSGESPDVSTFQTDYPKCPHCGYELDPDDMNSQFSEVDLWALAPREESATVQCPQCDKEYAVRGGYRAHYTSTFTMDELDA